MWGGCYTMLTIASIWNRRVVQQRMNPGYTTTSPSPGPISRRRGSRWSTCMPLGRRAAVGWNRCPKHCLWPPTTSLVVLAWPSFWFQNLQSEVAYPKRKGYSMNLPLGIVLVGCPRARRGVWVGSGRAVGDGLRGCLSKGFCVVRVPPSNTPPTPLALNPLKMVPICMSICICIYVYIDICIYTYTMQGRLKYWGSGRVYYYVGEGTSIQTVLTSAFRFVQCLGWLVPCSTSGSIEIFWCAFVAKRLAMKGSGFSRLPLPSMAAARFAFTNRKQMG